MPSWIALILEQDELDVAPAVPQHRPPPMTTRTALLDALTQAERAARDALGRASDEHFETTWRLLAGGSVVAELPRHAMIRDTFNHLAHHRGQMTVYLRLMGATVPALYGPSADERRYD